MAWPAEVILRPVVVGGSYTIEAGSALHLTVVVRATRGLMWDGVLYLAKAESHTSTGAPITLRLPATISARFTRFGLRRRGRRDHLAPVCRAQRQHPLIR